MWIILFLLPVDHVAVFHVDPNVPNKNHPLSEGGGHILYLTSFDREFVLSYHRTKVSSALSPGS